MSPGDTGAFWLRFLKQTHDSKACSLTEAPSSLALRVTAI